MFKPSVRVSNHISSTYIPISTLPIFHVEIPIEGCVINLPDTTRIDRELELDYKLVAGSNVLHTWFIDGTPFFGSVFQPQREGIFEIALTVRNNLNSLTVTKSVSVESKLSSVTFAENLGSYHKLSAPVEFELVLAPQAEFNVKYEVNLGDGTVYNSSEVTHFYPDIGIFEISIKVSNTLSNIRLKKTLNVQDEILRVMIKGSLMVLKRQLSSFNAEVFKKSTAKLEENVHYVWKLNGVIQEQDASDFSILLENSGTYTLGLTVYNQVSEQSVSETLVVTNHTSCHPPRAHITGDDKIRVLSTETVTFEANISTNCAAKHLIKWSVLTLKRELVQDFMESRSKTLTFRPYFLEQGDCIMRLKVFVEDSPDLYQSDEVMMTVVSVPIIPILNYPTFTTTNTKETLHISLADSLIVNKSLSLEDFYFVWSCSFRSVQRDYNPCLELNLSSSHNISAHFNVSGFADLAVNIYLEEPTISSAQPTSSAQTTSSAQPISSAHLVLNVTNYVVPLLKLTVSDLHELSPQRRTVVSLQCSHRGVPCFGTSVFWSVTELENEECGATTEQSPASTFKLTGRL